MSSLLRQLQVGSEASTVPELLAVERNRVQMNTLMWVVGQEGSLKPGLTTRGTSAAPQKHSSKSARPMEAKPCCAFDDGHSISSVGPAKTGYTAAFLAGGVATSACPCASRPEELVIGEWGCLQWRGETVAHRTMDCKSEWGTQEERRPGWELAVMMR